MDLQILHLYQQLREAYGTVLTPIVQFISDAGASTMAFCICSIFYWCISKQLGERILFANFGGSIINQTLKNTFCVYRPWIRDTTIIPAEDVSGYSFPSGHSQMSAGVYGNIFLFYKKNKKIVAAIALLFAILIPIARNYLGVHTPQDVIVGSIEGIGCIFLFNYILDKANKSKDGDLKVLLGSILVIILHLLYVSLKSYPIDYTAEGTILVDPVEMTMSCYGVAGLYLGIVLGWFLERRFIKFSTDISLLNRILRGIFGVVGFVVVSLLVRGCGELHLWFGTMLGCFIMTFFISFGWPLIFTLVGKCFKKKEK